MAEFLYGEKLNYEIQEIFEKANSNLILISPFIQLHDRLKSTLKSKKEEYKLEVIIVFGKNEDNISKSLSEEDFNFLKDFPNISILYEKRLHAKYYANEYIGILTSMNLYSYSQNNNIEFGVLSETRGILNKEKLDQEAWEYFKRVIEQAEEYFIRTPQYEKSGVFGLKKYTDSKTEIDKLSDVYKNIQNYSHTKSFATKERESVISRPNTKNAFGFCIRTGVQIPFNPKRPFSEKAYESWVRYKDENYPEKFCHFSGESSNGETCFAKPILKKNWKKAKETFNL